MNFLRWFVPPAKAVLMPGKWQRDGLRFVLFGLVNTAVTFGVYCLLVIVLPAQLAYFLVYAFGVVLAYIGNAKWVFQTAIKTRSALAYPLVQLAQYLSTATVLELLYRYFAMGERVALALAIVLVTPLAFLMNRYFFIANRNG